MSGKVTRLSDRTGYRPDLGQLARQQVNSARLAIDATPGDFAALLAPLLDWDITAELVESWETDAVPPGDVIIAAGLIAQDTPTGRRLEGDPIGAIIRERYADLAAVYATRTDFTEALAPADLFDTASTIDAVGLSLNLLCQQYSDTRLRAVLERGAHVRLLFIDPAGEAVRRYEIERATSPDR